jgi:hypothetical protein
MTTQQPKALPLCDSPGDTCTGLKLTPTIGALGILNSYARHLGHANEDGNADVMLKRYDGTNPLWGTHDFVWWCFFANWAGTDVTSFFVETEHTLDFEEDWL